MTSPILVNILTEKQKTITLQKAIYDFKGTHLEKKKEKKKALADMAPSL